MRPNKNHNFKLTVLAVSITAGLTACGGGGTSGALIAPAPATPTAYTNPDRVTWTTNNTGAAAGDVQVAVVDAGFKADHFEIADAVVATRDQAGSGSIVATGNDTHGTYVAQVIGGKRVGFSGNVDLTLIKAADAGGTVWASNTGDAATWAMDNGVRVVNLSLSNVLRTDVPQLLAMYDKAVAKNALIVAGAGNSSANLTTDMAGYADVFDAGNATRAAQTLVVGALDGNTLASYSNYAGESANIQNRFLVTSGTAKVQDYTATSPESTADINTVTGTSFAAPTVTAAAATIMSYWPHMTADAVASLLLSKADRSFTTLYSQNNCGSGGTTNCGLYYFGQGKLNLAGAMAPVGLPTIPISYTLSGPSVSVASSSLTLPLAFGDAARSARVTAAMFDDYGRDFRFNAFGLVGKAKPTRFSTHLLSHTSERETGGDQGSAFSSVRFDGNGAVKSMRFGFDGGTYSANFAHGQGASFDQHDSPMHMVTLAGSGNLGAFGTTDAFGLGFNLAKGVKIEGRSTFAFNTSQGGEKGSSANRNEVAVKFTPADGTTLSVGYAVTTESGSMLGSSGQGALGLNGSVQQAATFKMRQDLGSGWTAFGQAEFGSMAVTGSGMLTNLSGARTTQFGAGLAWAGKDSQFGLSVSQPIRVGSATAYFDAPVGRDLAGNVIRAQQSATLAPSGRQVNFELAYSQQLSPLSGYSLNAVYARDYGHVQGNNEAAVIFSYRKAW